MDAKTHDRFNNFVKRSPKCWEWTGAKRAGYGMFHMNGSVCSAHRVAYEMWVGELSKSSVVHHKCSNRSCVRPSHLQLTSSHENVAEMFERNNYLRAIRRLEIEVIKLRKQLEENTK